MCEEIGAWDPTLETRVEHVAKAAPGRIKGAELRMQTSRLSPKSSKGALVALLLFSADFVITVVPVAGYLNSNPL